MQFDVARVSANTLDVARTMKDCRVRRDVNRLTHTGGGYVVESGSREIRESERFAQILIDLAALKVFQPSIYTISCDVLIIFVITNLLDYVRNSIGFISGLENFYA